MRRPGGLVLALLMCSGALPLFVSPASAVPAYAKDGPTGPTEANNTGMAFRRDIQFTTESPAFEMGKLIWNDLLPDAILPTDSFNIEAGVDQLPTPFSAEANRLSVNPYLIYRRRALDLLSPTPVGTLLVGNEGDRLLRLGEPQIQIALMGLGVPVGTLTDLAKPEYLALPKHVVAYARYDWIEGDHFNDTALGGVTGPMSPHEWDAVVGIQWYVLENLRIGPEYLYRKYTNDGGRPVHEKLTEDFFSF